MRMKALGNLPWGADTTLPGLETRYPEKRIQGCTGTPLMYCFLSRGIRPQVGPTTHNQPLQRKR